MSITLRLCSRQCSGFHNKHTTARWGIRSCDLIHSSHPYYLWPLLLTYWYQHTQW